ncbi:hypothetical protein PFI31113_04791 [Pandoraea fibrosis]|uniref:Uncharacterized protein n=1 Tax=Pandoraea fibrosis TaxID=1891094 RepID=A0A5E4YWZ7_9BURK|nr:hypothetical protein PFI31113_04791 [Pandoraea fibrosis]
MGLRYRPQAVVIKYAKQLRNHRATGLPQVCHGLRVAKSAWRAFYNVLSGMPRPIQSRAGNSVLRVPADGSAASTIPATVRASAAP